MTHADLVSVAEALGALAAQHPRRVVLRLGEQAVDAAALEDESNRLAHFFGELGVGHGDFVTIALANSVRFVESVFAIWKLGATPQPVSPRLPPNEMRAIIDLAAPSLVLGVPDGFTDRPSLQADFVLPNDVSSGPHPFLFAPSSRAPTSGGSTGRPKLIIDSRPAAFTRDPFLPEDSSVVIPGPLYHTAPFSFTMRAIMLGNEVTIFDRFDAEETLEAIASRGATFVYLVPTMMSRMWKLPPAVREPHDLSSLSTALHTAAPCPEWLKRVWIDWVGDALVELYSSTEGAAKMLITAAEWLDHPGSVGRPVAGDEIRIFNEDGVEVPNGTIGNVYMRSSQQRAFTYRGAPQAKSIDGFVTIGDMGHVDADGYLYLADRRTDLILRGGANIFPAEVEAAIESFDGVRSVAVIGVPDNDLGQRVHAVVDAPVGIDEDSLRRHVAEQLVSYKCPEHYYFVDEPVRDDAGKVRRSALGAALDL